MRKILIFTPGGGEALELRLALSHALAPARGEIHIAVPRDSVLRGPTQLMPVDALESFRSIPGTRAASGPGSTVSKSIVIKSPDRPRQVGALVPAAPSQPSPPLKQVISRGDRTLDGEHRPVIVGAKPLTRGIHLLARRPGKPWS